MKTTRPCDKLDYQRLGPFVIIDQINDVADLPSHMYNYPIFHVSLLEPSASSSILDQVVSPPPPIHVFKGPEFEVEAILDSKIMRNKLYYFVYWLLGYSASD